MLQHYSVIHRENSLFDTEKTSGSQFNTQSWNVPYPTSAEIYVPRMALLSEWACNGVNWDAKRWFCPSFSFLVWTPSLLYRNYCWPARRCFNAISFFNLTWLLFLEYKNDLVFFWQFLQHFLGHLCTFFLDNFCTNYLDIVHR
jgi:hypothetical protein